MSLVKLVITITKDGARTRRVRIRRIFRLFTSCAGFSGAFTDKSTIGICGVSGAADRISIAKKPIKIKSAKNLFITKILTNRRLKPPPLNQICLKFTINNT